MFCICSPLLSLCAVKFTWRQGDFLVKAPQGDAGWRTLGGALSPNCNNPQLARLAAPLLYGWGASLLELVGASCQRGIANRVAVGQHAGDLVAAPEGRANTGHNKFRQTKSL
jgi:hypothetical protein